jgi:hypothetical protein
MFGKKRTGGSIRTKQTAKQKLTFRQIIIVSTLSIGVIFSIVAFYNLASTDTAKADTTTETIKSGSFIVNMGITPQTVANGLKPYGLVYDLVVNYQVPVKWVIEPTKAKDGTDFTYNSTAYKGGPFIIPVDYIDTTVAARITYWQSLGVQGTCITSDISVPVYMTITSFPLVMIDILSGNQAIVKAYYTNAGIDSTAYYLGTPSGLTTCHDLWANPHGDPAWSTHNPLYNFATQQKSYIWSQCHAVSMLEGSQNGTSSTQRLNFLTTLGLKCWKTSGSNPAAYCGPSITETHSSAFTTPITYYYPSDPLSQFMSTLSGAMNQGSERWFQPQSTGQWRTTTMRLVTTATGTSPKEGVLMVYGPAFGDTSNGKVMYMGSHDFQGSGTVAEQVAAQRAFLNFNLLAGKAKQLLFSYSYMPSSWMGMLYQWLTVTVSSGMPPYTYQWSSTIPGVFGNPTANTTTFTPDQPNSDTSGVIRCVVTDACGRKNFISTVINVTPGSLPVTLVSFDAEVVNKNSVLLKWETAAEVNNHFFTIERSADGQQFSTLRFERGAGNSTSPHSYSYTDAYPIMGTSYYRLKQTDFDGKSETFRTIPVTIRNTSTSINNIRISPNPFENEFTTEFTSDESKQVTLELLTVRSKVVRTEQFNMQQGVNTWTFSGGSALMNGMHILRITDGSTVLATAKAIKR